MTTVLYSIAHSDPGKPSGAVTPGGVGENLVANDAGAGLKMFLKNKGINCERFSGPLEPTVRRMRKAISALRKIGERHVSLELHFNSPPPGRCHVCGQPKLKGRRCEACGARPRRPWRIGHTAMITRWAPLSVVLADCILSRLSGTMPWSLERKPILMPDHRYGPKVWPEQMYPPAALVEAGFGCDPDFASLVSGCVGRQALGVALGNGVADFLRKTQDIPVAEWGRNPEVKKWTGRNISPVNS